MIKVVNTSTADHSLSGNGKNVIVGSSDTAGITITAGTKISLMFSSGLDKWVSV